MQFYSSQCLTRSYKHFMGNCTGRNREKEDVRMQSPEVRSEEKRAEERRCHSDPPSEASTTTPGYENGDLGLKSNHLPKVVPCKIPVLKDGLSRTCRLNPCKGSYKSVLFDRPLQSRIPVNSTNVECRKSVPLLCTDNDLAQAQFDESGFVSDLSVTASTNSHANHESKTMDTSKGDIVDVVVHRHHRLINNPPTNDVTREDDKEKVDQLLKHDSQKVKCTLPEIRTNRSSATPTKSVSTYNVDGKLKRPQSLSSESELLLNKALSRRSTMAVSDVSTPLAAVSEQSSVMQDVSSLKLMLHKLKRYLIQDSEEGCPDLVSEYMSRLPSSLLMDVRGVSREELEHQYLGLLERNAKLERLLESRDKVICQLEAERKRSSGGGRGAHSSALGDSHDSGSADPTSRHDQRPDQGPLCYQWSNLKLPQGHI